MEPPTIHIHDRSSARLLIFMIENDARRIQEYSSVFMKTQKHGPAPWLREHAPPDRQNHSAIPMEMRNVIGYLGRLRCIRPPTRSSFFAYITISGYLSATRRFAPLHTRSSIPPSPPDLNANFGAARGVLAAPPARARTSRRGRM